MQLQRLRDRVRCMLPSSGSPRCVPTDECRQCQRRQLLFKTGEAGRRGCIIRLLQFTLLDFADFHCPVLLGCADACRRCDMCKAKQPGDEVCESVGRAVAQRPFQPRFGYLPFPSSSHLLSVEDPSPCSWIWALV